MLIHCDETMLCCIFFHGLKWKAGWIWPRGWARGDLNSNLKPHCLLPYKSSIVVHSGSQWKIKKKQITYHYLKIQKIASLSVPVCLSHSIFWIKLYKKNRKSVIEHSNLTHTHSSWSELKLDEEPHFCYQKYFCLYLQEKALNFILGLWPIKHLFNTENKEKNYKQQCLPYQSTLNCV